MLLFIAIQGSCMSAHTLLRANMSIRCNALRICSNEFYCPRFCFLYAHVPAMAAAQVFQVFAENWIRDSYRKWLGQEYLFMQEACRLRVQLERAMQSVLVWCEFQSWEPHCPPQDWLLSRDVYAGRYCRSATDLMHLAWCKKGVAPRYILYAASFVHANFVPLHQPDAFTAWGQVLIDAFYYQRPTDSDDLADDFFSFWPKVALELHLFSAMVHKPDMPRCHLPPYPTTFTARFDKHYMVTGNVQPSEDNDDE